MRVDASAVLGEVGQGLELTKDWFVEARLQIAAHTLGAATRATELANDYAAERMQFGQPIRDFQALEFMLADMATEIMAAKSRLYRDVRVDRIWEGTSEIQRAIIAGQIKKRGVGVYTEW